MQSPISQIFQVPYVLVTELPNTRREKWRQIGAHRLRRRTLSSSMLIEDLAKLPGNSEVLGGLI
jgi:hypothetical protein